MICLVCLFDQNSLELMYFSPVSVTSENIPSSHSSGAVDKEHNVKLK